MTAFDIAEGRLLVALFIAHHAERREILTWRDIEALYHINISEMQFEAIVAELAQRNVVKVFRDKDGSGVLLLDHGVRLAHDCILRFLDAETFDVNWKAERILTDAPEDTDVPCPNGWMIAHTKKVDRKMLQPVAAEVRAAAPMPVGVTAGRDVIMNVGSPGARADASPESKRELELPWIKWQTILAALGVMIGIAAIAVAIIYT